MQFLETVVLKENLHVKTVMTWTIPGYLEGLLKFTITTVKERNLFMIRHLILQTMKWFSIGLEKNGQRTAGMEVIYINILIFTHSELPWGHRKISKIDETYTKLNFWNSDGIIVHYFWNFDWILAKFCNFMMGGRGLAS